MNREFVFDHGRERASVWARAGTTLHRWAWGALCCGVPGVPCYFCTCCEHEDARTDTNCARVNQSTATAERLSRPHRPHAPRGRKSTPEMLSAVRCALNQLQGEPGAPLSTAVSVGSTPEPG